jgi:hypothetical protein
MVVVAAVATLMTACGGGGEGTGVTASLPTGSRAVTLDPGSFTAEIDNPYWPMVPGTRWVYRETDGPDAVKQVVVTVTSRTRRILGIDARVIHDVVTEDGRLVEDTYDWVAQDADGNIWYLGEDTTEYEDGRAVSTSGSWQAGVEGAEPGVLVPAAPVPGLAYRQEYLEGEAEDAAEVLRLDGTATVPAGRFGRLLVTRDTTPLEPGLVERKYYARGVGPVLAEKVSGGSGREELVAVHHPD